VIDYLVTFLRKEGDEVGQGVIGRVIAADVDAHDAPW
jgi:hypothetical protein